MYDLKPHYLFQNVANAPIRQVKFFYQLGELSNVKLQLWPLYHCRLMKRGKNRNGKKPHTLKPVYHLGHKWPTSKNWRTHAFRFSSVYLQIARATQQTSPPRVMMNPTSFSTGSDQTAKKLKEWQKTDRSHTKGTPHHHPPHHYHQCKSTQ